MWYLKYFEELKQLKNEDESIKMSAYMKDNFVFLGVKKPKLNEFVKPLFKESKNYDFDWNFVDFCWQKNYREAQYIAIDYLIKNVKKIKIEDMPKIENLIVTKSWWDSVDSLDYIVGELALLDISIQNLMLEWSKSQNIWKKRVSIDFQQRYKEKTNTELLEKIIINNFYSKEFFINKAIGWSLREYSKTNKQWVVNFLNTYQSQMNSLSVKEAKKLL